MKSKKAFKYITAFIFIFLFLPSQAQAQECEMESPFGVLEFLHWNHPWNDYKYADRQEIERSIQLMKEAGVGWVRFDFLWDEIEPEQGQFTFAKYDCIVDLLNENGINILGILNYSASWAAACSQWNCPPRDNRLFVNYAVKVAEHFKGRVDHWEVWNEPDSRAYWSDQDGMKGYCALLKDVYIAVKKVNPGCKILNGGLAIGLGSVNRLYDNGAGKYFDILNIHIFYSPFNPGSINGVTAYPKLAYKVMKRNGDSNKKIWVTEIGSPGVMRGNKAAEWWLGRNPTEKQQAAWLKEVYTELLKDKNVAKVFWAFFRDCKDHWKNGVDYFGIVRWNFSKKPAFKAYQDCVKNWKEPAR